MRGVAAFGQDLPIISIENNTRTTWQAQDLLLRDERYSGTSRHTSFLSVVRLIFCDISLGFPNFLTSVVLASIPLFFGPGPL